MLATKGVFGLSLTQVRPSASWFAARWSVWMERTKSQLVGLQRRQAPQKEGSLGSRCLLFVSPVISRALPDACA